MAQRPILYAESSSDVPTYALTAERLRTALGDLAERFEIVLRAADEPDLAALAEARYFVSLRFDVARMRRVARRLQYVHCLNAGVERYAPFDWLAPEAVLTNSSGVHADMVGEYGLMALLMLNRGLPSYIERQRAAAWEPVPARSVRGKVALIVGTGGLGAAIAAHARLLGMHLVGVNRSGMPAEAFDEVFPIDRLDGLLSSADFVVLACPLTEATRGLVDRARLTRMKPGAGLINVARGPVVETAALIDALNSGHLCGAVVDVVDTEPLPENAQLWRVPHLVITPHVSCDTADGYVPRGLEIFADNLRRESRGMPLRNVVDCTQGY